MAYHLSVPHCTYIFDSADKDLTQMLKEAFDYSIHLEKNYPGAESSSLPPARNYAWAQVTWFNHSLSLSKNVR